MIRSLLAPSGVSGHASGGIPGQAERTCLTNPLPAHKDSNLSEMCPHGDLALGGLAPRYLWEAPTLNLDGLRVLRTTSAATPIADLVLAAV